MITFSVLRNEDGIEDLEIKTKAVVMKRSSRLHELLGSLRPGARPLEGKSVYMHAVKSRHSAGIADVIRRLGGVSEEVQRRTGQWQWALQREKCGWSP